MESIDAVKLTKQLTRIADALELANAYKKKELLIEQKRFRRDYDNISETESIDSNIAKNGSKEKI
jgi:hypothetical protein